MDGSALTTAERFELETLRRRAYGPQPDIDASSLARLAHLERVAHHVDQPASVADADTVPPHPATDAEPRSADSEATPPAASPAASRKPWSVLRGVPRWLWVAAAALVLAIIASTVVLSPHPALSLAVADDDSRLPAFMRDWGLRDYLDVEDDEPVVRFESALGVTPYLLRTQTGSECLVVVFGESWSEMDCGRGSLRPIVDVMTGKTLPPPALDVELPPGSVVRFAYTGTGVDVWIEEVSQTQNP
jgi:hypothetical protein